MSGSTNTIGYATATLKHLMIDSGALYKNYGEVSEALLGATSGGNEFKVSVKTREISVDGLQGKVKGLTKKVSTDVTLKANMLEVSADTLKIALMGAIDTSTDEDYDIITDKSEILDTDYIGNIAIVGKISGSNLPIVIILKNVLSTDGITINNKDATDNTLPVVFQASIDPLNPTVSQYEIRYPKIV